MQPLSDDLRHALERKGLYGPARAAWVVEAANRVGKGRFRALSFQDGELVAAADSLPSTELQLFAPQFRETINKKLGAPLVRSIRFKNK